MCVYAEPVWACKEWASSQRCHELAAPYTTTNVGAIPTVILCWCMFLLTAVFHVVIGCFARADAPTVPRVESGSIWVQDC